MMVISDYFYILSYPLRVVYWRIVYSHCYCSLVHTMVLQVVDCDSSVLPIAGRPATIKWYAFYNISFYQPVATGSSISY